MGATDLLQALRDAGLTVSATRDRLTVTGPAAALEKFRPAIRANKAALLAHLKVGIGEAAIASRWWMIHYPDREPVEVSCTPPATYAEILERHPDAIGAEPADSESKRLRWVAAVAGLKLAEAGQPSAPLTASEETAIRAWLALIEENDLATIAEVIDKCQRDADARAYFLARARLEAPMPAYDDRRHCRDCRHLRGEVCVVANPGDFVSAIRGYQPVQALPRRCAAFEEHG